MRQPAIYIMASGRNGTLYADVTSNLPQRVFQHREGLTPGFTTRYGCKLLVYYEAYEDIVLGDRAREANQGRVAPQEAFADRPI